LYSCDHAQTDEQLKHDSKRFTAEEKVVPTWLKSTLGKGLCAKANLQAAFLQFKVPQR
jgi:hypothetical protein